MDFLLYNFTFVCIYLSTFYDVSLFHAKPNTIVVKKGTLEAYYPSFQLWSRVMMSATSILVKPAC